MRLSATVLLLGAPLGLLLMGAGGSAAAPLTMLLGPTANLQQPDKSVNTDGVDSAEIVRQLLELVDSTSGWPSTFKHVNGSGGAIHIRNQVFGFMTAAQQANLARATAKSGLGVSIESGGAFCGAGSGALRGASVLKQLAPFFAAGGRFEFFALESVFSRTYAGCKQQPQTATATEVADFAATIAKGIVEGSGSPPKFFLYDALPHMTVDKAGAGQAKWPRNVPQYNLDLGTLMRLLQAATTAKHVRLEGYWMDCPFEYSRDFPNATSPLPAGSGFQKVKDAAELVKSMGFAVGKTFNSQAGGQKSDSLFFTSTMADWTGTTKAGATLDYAMVESWYFHPLHAAPEEQPFTTTYTAKAVFDHATQGFTLSFLAASSIAKM